MSQNYEKITPSQNQGADSIRQYEFPDPFKLSLEISLTCYANRHTAFVGNGNFFCSRMVVAPDLRDGRPPEEAQYDYYVII